jgi:predicted ATP-grasp superfamily ATP-dependent carboligase
VIEQAEDAHRAFGLPFPLVVKPARSRVLDTDHWISNSVAYATSPEHLVQMLQELSPMQFPILAQERIEGAGIGVFACYDHGRLLALFSHQRIREKPPSGGVSVLRESIPVDPRAGEYACALLEALDWHGVAMVEFKLDNRDNCPKLMEINGRFWGSLQLAIDAGVDFPRMVAALLAQSFAPPVPSYRLGIQSRWLWGDIDALLSLLLKSREQLNLPPDHPGRWRTLLRFLLPWYPGLHYEVLWLSDPRPWVHETRNWFAQLLGRNR